MESTSVKDSKEGVSTTPITSTSQEEDPAHEVSGGSVMAAVFGIVKAMVGPAILYLPHSFADAGYAFAVVALWICTAMYLYTSQRLLQSWKYVKSKQQPSRKRTKSDTGIDDDLENEMASLVNTTEDDDVEIEMAPLVNTTEDSKPRKALKTRRSKLDEKDETESLAEEEGEDNLEKQPKSISYPQLALIAYGDIGETAVRAGITLMQLGICLTYFIFVPHNVTASIWRLTHIRTPKWLWLVGMVCVEMPLSSIKNIQKLVYTNILATCLIAFGLASCLYLAVFSLETTTPPELDDEEIGEISGATYKMTPWNDHWYLFIGTSVLLFEGSITLCIPLQEALQVPDSTRKFPVIYSQTISYIVLFYTFFGLACWSAFGNDVKTVLTTSLPEGVLATMVQLAYSVAVILTFPLQIFPALEIVVHSIEEFLTHVEISEAQELSPWQRRMVCSVVIVVLSIIGVIEMDNLGKVVSLMGSLLGCPLAFVFPPLIHSKIVPNAPKQTDYAMASMGFLAMVGATWITLATWSEPGERRLFGL